MPEATPGKRLVHAAPDQPEGLQGGGPAQRPAAAYRTDRRIARTQKAIKDAFFALIDSDAGDKITVSALAREADIDRKTFYLHYSSLEDLVYAISREIVEEVIDNVREAQGGKAMLVDRGAMLLEFDSAVRKRFDHHGRLVRSLPLEYIIEQTKNPIRDMIRTSFAKARGFDDQTLDYVARFHVAGTIAIYTAWLKAGEPMPIAQLADIARTAYSISNQERGNGAQLDSVQSDGAQQGSA